MVSSGLNNFYFFLGFEIIISSLISSLASYPSFISILQIDNDKKNISKYV